MDNFEYEIRVMTIDDFEQVDGNTWIWNQIDR